MHSHFLNLVALTYSYSVCQIPLVVCFGYTACRSGICFAQFPKGHRQACTHTLTHTHTCTHLLQHHVHTSESVGPNLCRQRCTTWLPFKSLIKDTTPVRVCVCMCVSKREVTQVKDLVYTSRKSDAEATGMWKCS